MTIFDDHRKAIELEKAEADLDRSIEQEKAKVEKMAHLDRPLGEDEYILEQYHPRDNIWVFSRFFKDGSMCEVEVPAGRLYTIHDNVRIDLKAMKEVEEFDDPIPFNI